MICPKCNTENPSGAEKCYICGHFFPQTPISTRVFGKKSTSKKEDKTSTDPAKVSYKQLKAGSDFGKRYLILEEIGRGGMGTVYKALDKEINEIVALKTVRPEIAFDEEAIERFKNEMKIARKITHKNVCRIYQFEEIEGIKCISMEFITGENLKAFVRRAGGLSMKKSLDIIKQVCEGLKEAHGFGIIHQDLKPHNIMINKEGNALITDFGIALFMESTRDQESSFIMGTPEYISPEQIDGKEIDRRSDIYTLGIILYELSTGNTPFKSDIPLTVAVMHLQEEPKDPREINPELSEGITKIIRKCMEKPKESRYPSVDDLLADIEVELLDEATAKEAKAKAGILGNLAILPVDEILKILFHSKKSGVLSLTQDHSRIDFFIIRGNIFRVDSNKPAHRIGQILLKKKKITPEDIENCLNIQRKVDEKFCQILRNHNLISKRDIEEMMSFRFEEIIFDALKWHTGYFDFEVTHFDKHSDELKDLIATNITSEVINKMEQWKKCLAGLPPKDSVPFGSESDLDEQSVTISEEIKEIISLSNGENTLQDIIQKSSLGEFLTVKALHELFKKNILIQLGAKFQVGELSVEPAQTPEIDKLYKTLHNIYSIAFSEINDKLSKKIDSKTEKSLTRKLKKITTSYNLTFNKGEIKNISSFQVDTIFKKAEGISGESTRIHNIISVLNELLQEQIKLMANTLGDKTKKETIDSIKNKINSLLKEEIHLAEKYGVASNLNKILK